MSMEGIKNLGKGLVAPALTVGVDLVRNVPVTTTMNQVLGGTEAILHTGNSFLNPLFNIVGTSFAPVLAGTSAMMLSNSILKNFDWMNNHKATRYFLNAIAAGVTFTGGTAAAPYAVAATAGYYLGKPIYNLGKAALSRTAGAIWGATGGAVAGAVNGAKNGLKNGFTGKPNIS
ncbi:hypothetical protein DLH72_02485 [Candidatus Gracilibacteria bacterium]|nr:MAG: hypothetical protein DLH72_02485 [Candidatus Gracilibacteria bacterium]